MLNYFLGISISSGNNCVVTVIKTGAVNCLIGFSVGLCVVLVPFIKAVLPCTRDTRFLQAVKDHSMSEYERLISDVYRRDVPTREVDSFSERVPKWLAANAFIFLIPTTIFFLWVFPNDS